MAKRDADQLKHQQSGPNGQYRHSDIGRREGTSDSISFPPSFATSIHSQKRVLCDTGFAALSRRLDMHFGGVGRGSLFLVYVVVENFPILPALSINRDNFGRQSITAHLTATYSASGYANNQLHFRPDSIMVVAGREKLRACNLFQRKGFHQMVTRRRIQPAILSVSFHREREDQYRQDGIFLRIQARKPVHLSSG